MIILLPKKGERLDLDNLLYIPLLNIGYKILEKLWPTHPLSQVLPTLISLDKDFVVLDAPLFQI